MSKKSIALYLQGLIIMFCSACHQDVRPMIVPGIEIKPKVVEQPKPKPEVTHSLGIIGANEPVYFLPMKAPFMARIDTGAETSSIDADNITPFERDGEKWVSFDLVNRDANETHHFEKKIHKQIKIRRIEESEDRLVVTMDVKMGGEIIKTQFTLAKRDKFNYQALIGRNILTGRAIVDTSLSNTLR